MLLNDSNTFQREGSIIPALQKEKLRCSVVKVTCPSKLMGITLNPELSGSCPFLSPVLAPSKKEVGFLGHCDRVWEITQILKALSLL